jgi:hypothetical protein
MNVTGNTKYYYRDTGHYCYWGHTTLLLLAAEHLEHYCYWEQNFTVTENTEPYCCQEHRILLLLGTQNINVTGNTEHY